MAVETGMNVTALLVIGSIRSFDILLFISRQEADLA